MVSLMVRLQQVVGVPNFHTSNENCLITRRNRVEKLNYSQRVTTPHRQPAPIQPIIYPTYLRTRISFINCNGRPTPEFTCQFLAVV